MLKLSEAEGNSIEHNAGQACGFKNVLIFFKAKAEC